MKSVLALAVLLASFAAGQTGRPTRILFLGNSYTYFNGMPEMFADLAREAGTSVEVKAVTRGGARLQQLYEETDARHVLESSPWDFVVLQEQSLLGGAWVNGNSTVNEPAAFHRWVRQWERDVREVHAEPVLYLTWARKAQPEQQAPLNWAYLSIGRELRARVAPVGPIWEKIRSAYPGLELFEPDGSHPSKAGSYVAACVLLQTILDQPCPALADGVAVPDPARLRELILELGKLSVGDKPEFKTAKLKAGRRPSPAELTGTWTGTMRLYDALLEVEFRVEGTSDSCSGRWRVAKAPDFLSVANLNCTWTEHGIQFRVDHLNGLSESHQAVLAGDTLSGVARVLLPTDYTRREGAWQLRRMK